MFALFKEETVFGGIVLLSVFLVPVFLLKNIYVKLSETSLILRSALRKETTIPYSLINRIELHTGEKDDSSSGENYGIFSIVVKGSFEGGVKVIETGMFDHKEIFTLIRKLYQNTAHAEINENIRKIISNDEKGIISKGFKEAAKRAVKINLR